MKRLAVYPVGIALLTVAWTLVPAGTDSAPPDALPKIAFNDNVTSAGTLREGVLEVELEIVEGAWHLLGDDEPGGEVLGLCRARGKAIHSGAAHPRTVGHDSGRDGQQSLG